MTREQRLVQVFVDLADTLVRGFDVLDLLHVLCERCVEVLDVGAAGAMLGAEEHELRLVAASSEKMRVLEAFEAQNGEGPCFDAYVSIAQVLVPDLNETADRWPGFTSKALDAGYRSAFGFPLRLRGQCIGALNLFRSDVGELSVADGRAGQALADAVTIAILQERALRESRELGGQLQGALDSRVVIEQAKGMVRAELDVDMDEAFERLRRYSQARNRPLREVAQQVVDGVLAPCRLPGSSE